MLNTETMNSVLPIALVCLVVFFVAKSMWKLLVVGVLAYFAWTYMPPSFKAVFPGFDVGMPFANNTSEIGSVAAQLKACGSASVSSGAGKGVPDDCKRVMADYNAADIQKNLSPLVGSASAVLSELGSKVKESVEK